MPSRSKFYKKILPEVWEINLLEAKSSDLEEISKERALGLSLKEMQRIKEYFEKEKRNPTDVELEALAQSWSEHCSYKTSRPILEKTVFRVKRPQGLVLGDDAGVVEFDDEYAYVISFESHNHPSALDPYGGAATGVGGILRDVLCMGAQPLALVDSLFFGPLDFPEKKIPKGTNNPRFLYKGVVKGIADYGNRVGIPTLAGMVYFDESYVGNCLVNVGCVGLVRKDKIARSKAGDAKDIFVLAGGKTGRDGIHGVTFASTELGEESGGDRPAVQLGYPIMKEPLIHACLEINEKGLLTGMKDLGGGGLSCASSEMAFAAGKGCLIDLDKVPLKEENLRPWEIWVSESQERMLLSVKPENVDKVLEIFEFWDIPAVVVGKVDNSQRTKARFKGKQVLNFDSTFFSCDIRYARSQSFKTRNLEEPSFKLPENLKEIALKILSSPRVGSKEAVVRRYDHEVRGNTTLKPLQGVINKQSHGDATVIKPLEDSWQGLAISSDVNPSLCRLDPYWGSASAVEEVVRNLVAINSKPHSLADCLNFGNPEKKYPLGEFVKSCEGLYFAAKSFQLPFVSGNVSFYNESSLGAIAPAPTVMGIGLVKDVRKVVSSDLKERSNLLYLMGETSSELGGSEYYRVLEIENKGKVPRVFPEETKKNMTSLLKAMDLGLVRSCHDLSEGGLFVSVAEMALGGDVGIQLNLKEIENLRTDYKLFSESNGRWLVGINAEKEEEFLEGDFSSSPKRVGKVGGKEIEIKDKYEKEKVEMEFSLEDLRGKWNGAIEKEVE